ncbi:hypothetical protein IEQ34_019590 [Dendrobium chrysotoxum]|uniref:ATPase AAA-type core domain-containing protein n=1 Tax=Dendrobium chrysotoxum TaxID=161865 RepID=A0AAV7G7F1_DENCH|nr:hypothetical protein IEQ34_019590 [Dendrobium chrysotoxum]
MRRHELFSQGFLLFGPPRTLKTLLQKLLQLKLEQIWFGEAKKLTTMFFSFASQLVPIIIFINEVDSLVHVVITWNDHGRRSSAPPRISIHGWMSASNVK